MDGRSHRSAEQENPRNSHTISDKDAKAIRWRKGGAGPVVLEQTDTLRPRRKRRLMRTAGLDDKERGEHTGKTGKLSEKQENPRAAEHGRVPDSGATARVTGKVDNADLMEVKNFGPAEDPVWGEKDKLPPRGSTC